MIQYRTREYQGGCEDESAMKTWTASGDGDDDDDYDDDDDDDDDGMLLLSECRISVSTPLGLVFPQL